jgi:hypothetical protein
VVLVGAFVVWRSARGTHWRELAPGVEFSIVRGEPYCRRGSAAIGVLRLDPERVRLRVRHFRSESSGRPLDIVEWQRATGAVAVFNAGQYYPDLRYMGLLRGRGEWLSRQPHKGYQGLLVAGRDETGRGARVVDLALEPQAVREMRWSEVAQSFMLFDSTGALRVRRSERIANRTVVGEDRRHRVLVCVSEGAYTLADFAFVLQGSRLQMTHAMSMDGGREAELVVANGAFRYASFGPWEAGDEHPRDPGATATLPTVITVEAR